MAENYQQAAKDIIQLIGMDNIISVTHCQTRLRFILKDHEQVDGKQLEKIDLVKGVFYNGGQYQVILGTGIVTKVYDEKNTCADFGAGSGSPGIRRLREEG